MKKGIVVLGLLLAVLLTTAFEGPLRRGSGHPPPDKKEDPVPTSIPPAEDDPGPGPGPAVIDLRWLVGALWFSEEGRADPGYCPLITAGGFPGFSVHPVPGDVHPGREFGVNGSHSGIDVAVPIGTAVRAAAGGYVIWAGDGQFIVGKAVTLAHGGHKSAYAHLSAVLVGCGEYVFPGQVIGLSGGSSGWDHLHLTLLTPAGYAVDPVPYLP